MRLDLVFKIPIHTGAPITWNFKEAQSCLPSCGDVLGNEAVSLSSGHAAV